MNKPTIIFFGTPDFSAQVLDFLIDNGVSIAGVVTQPDRPKGRSLLVTLSPVKEVAQKKLPNVPIYQPERCSNPDFLQKLLLVAADLYVVVAFGQILPVKLLDIPPMGCLNVHASLLPKYRGAAPIQRCLINGDIETGISIQKMVKELDAGDVIVEKKIPISADMNYGDLERALCELSKGTLLSLLQSYAIGIPSATPQNHEAATYAAKIKPEEGQILWNTDQNILYNQIRGFSPRPGAWCWIDWNGEKKRLKVLQSKKAYLQGSPGEILSAKELIVACRHGSLQLLEVQLEGKPRMLGSDWFRGAPKSLMFL
jgi:methionyl-tRNA formyltransferase